MSREALESRIIPLSACLAAMRPVAVGPEEARRLRQGRPVAHPADAAQDGEQVRVLVDTELVAVARIRSLTPPAVLAPVRVFAGSEQEAVSSRREVIKDILSNA